MLRSIVVVLAAVALIAPAAARAQGPATEDALRSALAAQMAQGPAASGAYVVDLTDGHVVVDDRSADKRLSASVIKLLHDVHGTARARIGMRGWRPASSAPAAAAERRSTGTCTCAVAGTSRSAPRRSPAGRTGRDASVERLAAELRRSGLRQVRGRVFGDASLYSDNGGSRFELVLCSDPLFGQRLPVRSGRQAGAPDPQRPAHADRVQPRPARDETGAKLHAGQRDSPRAGWSCPDRVGITVDGGLGSARRRGRRARWRRPARPRWRGSPR